MKLSKMPIEQFNDALASHEPAPGGGSASALLASVGTALTDMVASLTMGKKKYADVQELQVAVHQEALALRQKLQALIDEDTVAFSEMSAVFQMPKETDVQKAARAEAMQHALKRCTETPYQVMELSLQALKLTQRLIGKSNASAVSDLGVAAVSLKAALQGAWLNVLINLDGLQDKDFAGAHLRAGNAILAEALPIADEIYHGIRDSFTQ